MKPVDPMLIDYLLGVATPEESAAFEQRLEQEPELRTQLLEMQEVVVHHAPNVEPLNSNLKARIMTSVGQETRFFGYADRLAELFDLSKSAVTDVLRSACRFPAQPWGPSLIPDMHALHFDGGERLAGVECGLVHILPGVRFPHHAHEGEEMTFMLQGELTDDSGKVYLPGDVVYLQAGESHGFMATGDVPLIFAVYHHGLDFQSNHD